MREIEDENRRLRRVVSDQAVDIQILKEVAQGNFRARHVGVKQYNT